MNQVEEESFYHSFEEEVIGVNCLFSDQISVSGVWCYGEDNFGNNLGVPGSNISMEGVDTTVLNAFDVLPHEVGVGNLLTTNSSHCDDYLLGYVSSVRNSQFPIEGSFGIQNSLTDNISGIECQDYLLSNCIFGSSTYSSGPNSLDRFDDFSNSFFDQDISPPHFSQKELDLIPSCQDRPTSTSSVEDHGLVGEIPHKRSRKPTKRYIDESSFQSLQNSKKRGEASSGSKAKLSGVRRVKSQNEAKPKAKKPSPEISFDKAIQVPFVSHLPTECEESNSPAKKLQQIETCIENCSKDKSGTMMRSITCGNRRKHHRAWTVSEVKKLLDGVARFGVGKWTHIKKHLFSSSVHRTPVDLKDKWRNLLKASRIEDDHKRGRLPKPILCRVRELASVYPYIPSRKHSKSKDF